MAEKRANKPRDLEDIPTGGRNRSRITDKVELLAPPTDKWVTIRPIGSTYTYGGHWIRTKKRDNKEANFYAACLAYDPESGSVDPDKECPWCQFREKSINQPDGKNEKPFVGYSTTSYINVVVKAEEKRVPDDQGWSSEEEESRLKVKESDSWTPVRVLRLTGTLIKLFKGLKGLNVHEIEGESQPKSVTDYRYGTWVSLKYQPEQPPAQQYQAQMGAVDPRSKKNFPYLMWDLSDLETPDELSEAKREFANWAQRMGFAGKKAADPEEGLDADEGDEPPRRASSKKPSRIDNDPDDTDFDEPKKPARRAQRDPDEFEDESPKRPAKKPSRAAAEDPDEFEDDPPKQPARRSQREEEPADEFEDEPKKPARRAQRQDPDEFEDEPKKPARRSQREEEPDEEGDTPRRPTKKPSRAAEEDPDEFDEPRTAKKPARRVEADADDNDPPTRSSKPTTKKAKPAADEFDDLD